MAKSNYTRVFTPVGVAVYPHLTEADTKFNSAGEYHTKLAVSRDDAENLIEKLEGIRDEFHAAWLSEAENAKEKKQRQAWELADVFEEELDDEGAETGRVIFKSRLTAHVKTKTGKEWDQEPMIFDSANTRIEPIKSLKLWGGSEIRLQCEVVPYAMASAKKVGVSLRLRAVQIVTLATGGGGSPFDEYDGGETINQPAAGPDEDDHPFSGADGDDDGDDY